MPEKMENTRDFAVKVRRLIDRIVRNNEIYDHACLNFFGVTTSQGSTILSFPPEGALTMNELSSLVGVDSSTMTRMVDQLVDKNLVLRKADDQDRRLVLVILTESGVNVQKALKEALQEFYKESLDEIPPVERESIIASLERLSASISRGLENCCKKYCIK
jgi:DNA-binding MarR family transcriptional regulator